MSKKFKNESRDLNISNEEYMKKKEVLTSFFSDSAYMLMTLKQIASILGVKKNEVYILEMALSDLEKEGIIYIDDSKRYVPTASRNIFKCIYDARSGKFGFARTSTGKDIYVSNELSKGAMDQDTVLVKILSQKQEGKNEEGQVIKILDRKIKFVIGRFSKSRNFGFVVSIDKRINDIYIPKKYSSNIKDGQMVKVEILKYATSSSKAEGRIIEVIGDLKDQNIEVKAMYCAYEIEENQKFNELVLKEIENVKTEVTFDEFKSRVDKTQERIFTIDGDDAKDLDDAISVKKLDNNTYMLSVYIADVSYYVKDGTAIDKEAISRGTSTYIPGTVVPMLTKELSNGICSLNEGVNRLALAIDINIDKDGNVLESNIYKAVIKVTKRMTYDKVYKVLNLEDMSVLEEYKDYEQELFLMKELALILNKKRIEQGSINFDIPETKIVLDENGNIIDLKPYEITIANKIIEEFMLIANMQIAEKFYYLELPFIYRIHEKPDEERLRELNEILSNYNKRIKGIKNVHPKTLADIIESVEEEEEKQVVSNYMLRTLKLARYSEECLGHFGLAAKFYCHFTSPIRRYPDLFIHRVISDYLESGYVLEEEKIQKYTKQAEEYAKISSDMEKQATQIERDFDDLYKTIYMSKFLGSEFNAIVSSVTNFGMFVRIDNTVEGLVPFDNMPHSDYYIFDEKKRCLIGRSSGETFKVGDKLKVKLVKCDVQLKQIDFSVVDKEGIYE